MAEIARALLVPEAAMAKRSSRAKQQLRSAGVRFDLPPAAGWAGRLQVVLHVLGLVFSQGYNSTSGPDLQRADLTTEAIPLARLLRQLVPADGEVAGLLALLLPTDARHAARTTADRSLVPLAEQRRGLWDTTRIEEGVALLTRTLGTVPVGPDQLQAANAAVHDEAPRGAETDWPQILALDQALG
jgi:predicted RNA polymerase sigma factor